MPFAWYTAIAAEILEMGIICLLYTSDAADECVNV